MIVRQNLKLKLIVRYMWKRMLWVVAGIVVGISLKAVWHVDRLNINVPLAILGTALAILIGFRNNNAYDRWWEARRLWGQLVNVSRNLAARVLALTGTRFNGGDEQELRARRQAIIYRHIGFVYALRSHLRRQEPWEELGQLVSAEELAGLRSQQNVPNALLLNQQLAVRELAEAGFVDDFRHMQLDNQLAQLYEVLGGCERIKNTPFPRQYTVYTGWATKIFAFLLPLGLGEQLGWVSIPFALVLGFLYLVLGFLGNNIENPFENTINDIPMTALARTVEINLRQNLGETALPAPVQAVDGYLY